MRTNRLRWELFDGKHVEPEAEVEMTKNGLVWLDRKEQRTTPVSWDQFTGRLTTIPADRWLNLHLRTFIPKETAIDRELDFASDVADLLNLLVPLYIASIQQAPSQLSTASL